MDILPSLSGNVDKATVLPSSTRDLLHIEFQGWILHAQEELVDLFFATPGASRIETRRADRHDIAARFPDIPHAKASGYAVSFEFPRNRLHAVVPMHLFATLRSGQQVSTVFELPLQLPEKGPEESYDLPHEEARQKRLEEFIQRGSRLEFPEAQSPRLSIIIVTHNRAHDTLACLSSLLSQATSDLEIIIIDNNSTDHTHALLEKTSGLQIVKNFENRHFLEGACQGADLARGELLLFLNNDTYVLEGGLHAVCESFKDHPNLGVLGARLIHLDGSLQEVGGTILPDGSTIGNGVGRSPHSVQYLLQRAVDYCSGAFLATPRELWKQLEGFDSAFKPAYYEDVDYCVRAHLLGREVLIEPRIVVMHAEGAKHHNAREARALMTKNRTAFVEKHREHLTATSQRKSDHPEIIPPQVADPKHILMIDDFFPINSTGQGAPRANKICHYLLSRGCRISCIALNEENLPSTPISDSLTFHLVDRGAALVQFLALHGASFGTVIISRPYNMESIEAIQSAYPIWAGNVQRIYDAEAIFILREIQQRSVLRDLSYSPSTIEKVMSLEIQFARHAHQVWTVSESEATEFSRRGISNVKVISYGVDSSTDTPTLEQRSGILFVGPLLSSETPNGDGFLWFTNQVLPILKEDQATPSAPIVHCGINLLLEANEEPCITHTGALNDLTPQYQAARVFIAPIRFGSGIPIKVLDAAAHGIPIVATSYIANQLGWGNDNSLLIADDAQTFASHISRLLTDDSLWNFFSDSVRRKVMEDYSMQKFHSQLSASLNLE